MAATGDDAVRITRLGVPLQGLVVSQKCSMTAYTRQTLHEGGFAEFGRYSCISQLGATGTVGAMQDGMERCDVAAAAAVAVVRIGNQAKH